MPPARRSVASRGILLSEDAVHEENRSTEDVLEPCVKRRRLDPAALKAAIMERMQRGEDVTEDLRRLRALRGS